MKYGGLVKEWRNSQKVFDYGQVGQVVDALVDSELFLYAVGEDLSLAFRWVHSSAQCY